MLDLSPETEALARRLAEARNQSVDETVKDALETRARMELHPTGDHVPSETIAARKARIKKLQDEIAALPILDRRPVADIVDDLNAI